MPPFRRLLRWALLTFAVLVLLGLLTAGLIYTLIVPDLPDVDVLRDVQLQEPLYVHARDGSLMAQFGENRRYPVEIEQVPEQIKQAFIAIEDNRFYEHPGVDYKGVSRAIWLLATTDDERVPGGSTITQQVARQFFLSSEYSYTRKLAEMLLALKMERKLSKGEIFELYLNKIFFGHRSYGIAAAAEFYYGKTLDELSLDEIATLAGTPKFPSSGNPLTNPPRNKIRRDYVLQRMAELDFISHAEMVRAQAAPMHAQAHEAPIKVYAPYVAEMVRREMIARYGGDILTKGYHVITTIDPELQAAAASAMREGLAEYDHRHGWRGAEQHFELADGADAEAASALLDDIHAQSGLLPALVLDTGDGKAQLVLRNGMLIELDADSTEWTRRSPAALLKRGDMVRVRREIAEPPKKEDAGTEAADDSTNTVAAVAASDAEDDLEAGLVDAHYLLEQLPQAQSALISLDPRSGAIRALKGGFSFVGSKFNRVTQARRQPGSSFKPFLYSASFERGFNPASIVLDAPVVFRDRAGHVWRPQNDGGGFDGPMRLREALVRSKNLVSVRLLDAIGVDYARDYIAHFGFDKAALPPNLSMALGTASVPPLTIARGFATFVNGGFLITPWFIDEVRDRDGKLLFKEQPAVACKDCSGNRQPEQVSTMVAGFNLGAVVAPSPAKPDPEVPDSEAADASIEPATTPNGSKQVLAPRAIDERIAYQMNTMLRDVIQRGTGVRAKVLGRPDIGGKTGSTNDYRDAWFSGFGDHLVTTVWVGNDDFSSLGRGEYGGRAALPIWIDYMRVALEGRPVEELQVPDNMVQITVNASGRLLPQGSSGIHEWIKVEDLARMQSAADDVSAEEAEKAEEVFDIF